MEALNTNPNIIESIRRGDNRAIKALYKSAFAYCASFVLNNKGSREDAKEIFQRSMIVLVEKARDPDFNLDYPPKSYLYAVTRNQWLKELKRKGRTDSIVNEEGKEIVVVDSDDDLQEKKEKESRFELLYDAMQKASEECRKLLQLTYFKKLKDKEIAPIMQYSLEFVRNKRRRCVKGMRKQLDINL